ncbi:hypothetical protein BGX20_002483 [Mortierella sp. AD010]|nr:hypothetical protein BGX20_002483 [Mortierella sp. AD010]
MDIPEIARYIAQFLNKGHLANAVAVSRTWNANFSQYLYETVEWRAEGYAERHAEGHAEGNLRNPTHETIQNHANDVRSLILKGNPSPHFPSRALTSLRDLQVSSGSWHNNLGHHLVILLGQNPALRSLRLHLDAAVRIPANTILQHLTSLQGLREVRFSGLEFSPQDLATLFDLCSRLETVRLINGIPPTVQTEDWPQNLSAVQSLHFERFHDIPLHIQSEIIQRCPQLRCLTVRVNRMESKIDRIRQICNIFMTHCTRLQDISIVCELLPKGALDGLLGSCNNLTSLRLPNSLFLEQTFNAFRPHFHSLTSLNAKSCHALTSKMVQGIMAGCPSLKTLRAHRLLVKDVLDEEEIVDMGSGTSSREWVCLGLETFSVCITGFTRDSYTRLIFRRLAKLTRLEVLDVGSGNMIEGPTRALKFSVNRGMDALVSLRRLRWLEFTGLRQQMSMADIQWMLQSWPCLERVTGILSTDSQQTDRLEAELQRRGSIKRDTEFFYE